MASGIQFKAAGNGPLFKSTGALMFECCCARYACCDHWNAETQAWEDPTVAFPLRTITFADLTGCYADWNGEVPADTLIQGASYWIADAYYDNEVVSEVPGDFVPCAYLGGIGDPERRLQHALWIKWWPQAYSWRIHMSCAGSWTAGREWQKAHTVGADDSAGTYTRVVGGDGTCVVS